MVSLGVMLPSGSAITFFVAFQATSVTVDVWVNSGQRKLAIEDLTTKKQEPRWVTFSRLLYLFCYCDLLFSSKEPQENSLNTLVSKRPLVCVRIALYLQACWSPFSGALSDKCSKAAMAEWTANTPGGWRLLSLVWPCLQHRGQPWELCKREGDKQNGSNKV